MPKRLTVLLGFMLVLASSAAGLIIAPARAAEPADVRLTLDEGGAKAVIAETIINAPVEVVWNELTDYGRIKNMLPGYERSTVLTSGGGVSTVDLALRAVPPFAPAFRYQVRIREDRAARIIHVQRISGDFKSLTAAYRLLPIDNGTRTRLVYQMQIDLGNLPTLGAGKIVKSNTGKQLLAFQNHCARTYQRSLTAQAGR